MAWGLVAITTALAASAARALVHPQRWGPDYLALAVARELAAGNVAAVVARSTPQLQPYLAGGHLAQAARPLQAARTRDAQLLALTGNRAQVLVHYADGRPLLLDLQRVPGAGWELAGLG